MEKAGLSGPDEVPPAPLPVVTGADVEPDALLPLPLLELPEQPAKANPAARVTEKATADRQAECAGVNMISLPCFPPGMRKHRTIALSHALVDP
jgi:hypothetical protein